MRLPIAIVVCCLGLGLVAYAALHEAYALAGLGGAMDRGRLRNAGVLDAPQAALRPRVDAQPPPNRRAWPAARDRRDSGAEGRPMTPLQNTVGSPARCATPSLCPDPHSIPDRNSGPVLDRAQPAGRIAGTSMQGAAPAPVNLSDERTPGQGVTAGETAPIRILGGVAGACSGIKCGENRTRTEIETSGDKPGETGTYSLRFDPLTARLAQERAELAETVAWWAELKRAG